MTVEVIYVNVPDIDQRQLPLIADIQWLEPYGADALNRRFSGVFSSGVARGFKPVPSAGLSIDLLHNQNIDGSSVHQGVALVEHNDFLITVHQQKTINIPVVAGQATHVVLNAFYQQGIKTKQVDKDSTIEAAEILALTEEQLGANHVTLCTVTLEPDATSVLAENIAIPDSRGDILPTLVRKTADGGAMVVPFSSDDNNPVDGLERWNPVKKRVEYSKGGKWNGMGGGGSTLKDVEIDTLLASGEGCIVDTVTAQRQIVITLSGNGNATAGDEHIVGDVKNGSAFKYPIKVVAEGDTKVDDEDEFLIDIDGARVTFNYNEEKDSWDLSSGFGERPTPKAVFHPFEAKAKKGDTTFNIPYSVGFVTYSLNGVEQSKDDFTATDGKTIALAKPIKRDGDVVQFKSWLLVDQLSDVNYTRKDRHGTANRGATSISLPAGFLQNDVAKSYYLEIGGVRQWPDEHYTVSSATNEILLKEPLDNDYDWYLLSEAQVQLFVGQDSQIDADNTNNSLTGKTVKENIDQLDSKYEKFLVSQTGLIGHFHNAGSVDGWLDLKGGTVSRIVDAILWQYAQTTGLVVEQELKDAEPKKYAMHFGDGNGVDTFTLPNHHLGHFERGTPANVEHGETQGDAIRNITGSAYSDNESLFVDELIHTDGAFGKNNNRTLRQVDPNASSSSQYAGLTFDASLVVPTALENRPYTANLSVKIFRGWI